MEKRVHFLDQKNIFQILCILCISVATFSIFTAYYSPAVGYEPSIYKSTPFIFWISVLFLIITGLVLIIYCIFYDLFNQTWLWFAGLFCIFLSYIMCISLLIIRGYFMWCINGDPATHIGEINQITLNGDLPVQLFYPAFHIYVSQLFLVSNISLFTLHKILPLIFGVLYFFFSYIFSRSIFSEKSQIILSTLAASTLINDSYLNFVPNGLANLYFPLLLFIFIKVVFSRKVRWELLMVIMVLFYPIFHPVPTIAIFLILTTFFIPNYVLTTLTGIKKCVNYDNNSSVLKITLTVLLLFWGVYWLSSFYMWGNLIKNLYSSLNGGGSTHLLSLATEINYAKSFGYNVTEQILIGIGGPALYILFSIITLPILYKNKDIEKLNPLFSLYGPLITISLLMIILYFSNIFFGPLRMLIYVTIISTPFVGYFLNFVINKLKTDTCGTKKFKNLFRFIFIISIFLFFMTWINGVFTLYPSPYTLTDSYQTTQTEVKCMNWLFETKKLDQEITGMTIVPFRYANLLLTPEQRRLHLNLSSFEKPTHLKVPFHFGYDKNTLLSDYYNKSVYMVIDEEDKLIYTDIYPKMAKIRWEPNDFQKLDDDLSTNKIYSSEKTDVYYISGSEKK